MADWYVEDTQGLRQLSAPARNNYFYGKLLDVQHFTLEQRYFNNKRWLLNRLVLGSGIVCGLNLTVTDDHVCLQPGVAIDPLGREIIVPQTTAVDPRQATDACGRAGQGISGRHGRHHLPALPSLPHRTGAGAGGRVRQPGQLRARHDPRGVCGLGL